MRPDRPASFQPTSAARGPLESVLRFGDHFKLPLDGRTLLLVGPESVLVDAFGPFADEATGPQRDGAVC